MNYGVATAHGRFERRRITDITSHKRVIGMLGDRLEIREIPGIRQFVIINDGVSLP